MKAASTTTTPAPSVRALACPTGPRGQRPRTSTEVCDNDDGGRHADQELEDQSEHIAPAHREPHDLDPNRFVRQSHAWGLLISDLNRRGNRLRQLDFAHGVLPIVLSAALPGHVRRQWARRCHAPVGALGECGTSTALSGLPNSIRSTHAWYQPRPQNTGFHAPAEAREFHSHHAAAAPGRKPGSASARSRCHRRVNLEPVFNLWQQSRRARHER
jgi:hypothetical protein